MKASIITLCWNHLEDVTKPFLHEIFKTSEIEYEVIFVDNGSEDGTSKFLSDRLWSAPNVKIIKSDKNLGWSGGNNLGIKYASGDYICFINNDVIINDPEWLKKAVDYLEEHKNVIIGPEVITDQPAARWNDTDIHYLNGWCIISPREFLDKYGCFHKAFNTPYLEDVEFCVRAKHYGWDWELFPLQIQHLGARSTYDQIDMWGNANASRQTFIKLMNKLETNPPIEEYLSYIVQ